MHHMAKSLKENWTIQLFLLGFSNQSRRTLLLGIGLDSPREHALRCLSDFEEHSIIFGNANFHKQMCASRLLEDNRQLVDFADNEGWTILHYAVDLQFDSMLDVIKSVQISVGYQVTYVAKVKTPFHVAAERGYNSTMILLLQMWPTASSPRDENGSNILHLAAAGRSKETIQAILRYCPRKILLDEILNMRDAHGNRPLHILMENGCYVPQLMKHEGLHTMYRNVRLLYPRDMLYLQHEIIGDQVQMKMMLDHIQTDEQKNERANNEVSKEIRDTKDAIFNVKIDEARALTKVLQEYKSTNNRARWIADAIAGNASAKAAVEIEAEKTHGSEQTILHIESEKGDPESVRYILKEFANKNLLDKLDISRKTSLHVAAENGCSEVVEVLIDAARHLPCSANDDPDSICQAFIRRRSSFGHTALHLAVLGGKVATVKILVEADLNDIHIQSDDDKSPLYIAAAKGYKSIIELICRTHTAQSLEAPFRRETILHTLIKNIQHDTEEAIDMIRIIINAAKRWNSAAGESYATIEAFLDKTDEDGRTVLQLAVERNYVDVVRLILTEHPAYKHGRTTNGLMHLIDKAIHKDIVKLLSETYEAAIAPEYKGLATLILAIKRRDKVSVLRLLEENKQLVFFAEDEGWTPLHYAAYHELVSVLDAIIKAQEDANHTFMYKDKVSTPLHVAAEKGNTLIMIRILQKWPPESSAYTAVDKNGRNILHLAADKKETVEGIMKWCLPKYFDKILKQKDTDGNTPLHLLISHGCFIPELLKHKELGAMVKNNENWTPPDMLYSKDDIIADQVEIKMALDVVQTDHPWKFWRKSVNKESFFANSVVLSSKRETKDKIFNIQKKDLIDKRHAMKKEGLERYKERTNTQIIVTALITTVAFTVGFTMPGGLGQSGAKTGLAVFSSGKTSFNAFMVLDSLALLLSTSSLFFYFLQSMNEDPRQVKILNAASTVLNIISVIAMMLTFITGTYVVLSDSPVLAITICVIGSLFFVLIIVMLIVLICCDCQKRRKEHEV